MLAFLRFSVSTVSKAVLQIERRGEIEPHDKSVAFSAVELLLCHSTDETTLPHSPQAFAHIILPLSRILTLGSFTDTSSLAGAPDAAGVPSLELVHTLTEIPSPFRPGKACRALGPVQAS